MNKQQLASKIWESANKMRSKIEANEYKDYILGFIFYKFLSDKEVEFLKEHGMSDGELERLAESDRPAVDYCKSNLGYFVAYENLFSSWLRRDAAKTFDTRRCSRRSSTRSSSASRSSATRPAPRRRPSPAS